MDLDSISPLPRTSERVFGLCGPAIAFRFSFAGLIPGCLLLCFRREFFCRGSFTFSLSLSLAKYSVSGDKKSLVVILGLRVFQVIKVRCISQRSIRRVVTHCPHAILSAM